MRICFLSLSMNQFTWYTVSIVGLKSISAKCLGLHWWLDELNREQSVTWVSFIARIPNAFSLPLKWPQFQDALLWALGQKALCILIPFIFNQDQNILPNLCKLPLAARLQFCYVLIDLAVLLIVYSVSWLLLLLIFQVRTIALLIWIFPIFLSFSSSCKIILFPTIVWCETIVCSAHFTQLSKPTYLSSSLRAVEGFLRAGVGNLPLWYNEFDNESDIVSSLDLAVWSIITMAHHFLLWILTFLP